MWREENVYEGEKITSIHGEGTSQVSIPGQIGESGMPNHWLSIAAPFNSIVDMEAQVIIFSQFCSCWLSPIVFYSIVNIIFLKKYYFISFLKRGKTFLKLMYKFMEAFFKWSNAPSTYLNKFLLKLNLK